MPAFSIGTRQIGDGFPCFVIAEAGSNHNGNLDQARALIEVAAEAGADAVKFQNFQAARLYPRSAGQADYLNAGESIFEIVRRMEMPPDWIPLLAEYSRKCGILFFSTPADELSADLLDPHVDVFKVASYEITHQPLIEDLAKRGKPIIASTGAADLEEVRDLVEWVQTGGPSPLALMHCTACYPAPPESLNVRAVVTMKAEFGLPVGFSDHSRDPLVAPIAAVSLGANLIEKHVTLSNRLPGPDHRFAIEPKELKELVRHIREVERALGDGRKVRHESEEELFRFARRSIYTIRPVARGERFTRENIAVLRSGKLPPGLPPYRLGQVLGSRATSDLPMEAPITDAMYEHLDT